MIKRSNYLLAIGIDKYKSGEWENLDNAVNDTKALIDVLTTKYSFELIQPPLYNEDATRENIFQAITNTIPILTEDDNLVIYFGGHGFMHPLTLKGFWIPHEARKNTADFISNSDIKDFIENMPAKHIFLIADACFSGTFLTRTRGGAFDRSYSSLDNKKSRWMLASGGEESVSDGPVGKGSPFSRYLIKFLNETSNQFSSVQEIIRYVSVLTSHHSRQQPKGAQIENIGHEGGQMVLVLRDGFFTTKVEKTNGDPQTEILAQEMRSIYRRKSKISAGKEIFLVDSFINSTDLQIWECFRFDDNGEKKIKYEKNKIKMPAKDDPNFSLTLHARFATWESLGRYWEENKQLYEGRKVLVLNASEEIEHVEETKAAIHQQGIVQDMLDANQEPMRCLHCNNMITNNNSFLVEIDEMGLKETVGNVHAECRRPADRILGKTIFKNPHKSNLVNFDYKKWAELLSKGQTFLSNTKKATSKRKISILSWNKKHNFNLGEYCICIVLEDGSSKYVRLGKEIHRFPTDEIDKEISNFNKSLVDAEQQGDPMGFTSESKLFGSFSQLKESQIGEEKILKVIRYEKAKYSQQINDVDNEMDNDYTPLGILVHPGAEGFVVFGNCIPLISDPLKFDKLHKNWNEVGYKIGECSLKIIDSDKDFDLYLMAFFSDGVQPIIDPVFNNDKELLEGIYIRDFEELKDQGESHKGTLNPDGIWKAGDRVKVVFPEVKTDKFARGILLTDEFIDEKNESCVIFRPIENGAVREDLQFKMPTKLLVKD